MPQKPRVGIAMGSDSDLTVMQEAADVCKKMGVAYEMNILSAHRTPKEMMAYAKAAQRRGIKVIIAGAGGAAHLAGVFAALTSLPVIGVPILSKSLQGLDALLSTVQMPPGVPVAAVAIGGGTNAGLLACQILATHSAPIAAKLARYKQELGRNVRRKNRKLKRR